MVGGGSEAVGSVVEFAVTILDVDVDSLLVTFVPRIPLILVFEVA